MTEGSQVDRVRDVFDDWARRGRAEGMEQSHTPFVRQAFERLNVGPSDTYLDIGCGNGYTVLWAAERAPNGNAVGVDVSTEMIERARTAATGRGNVAFHVVQFPDHPFAAMTFDAVLSMEVFYYFSDIDAALRATRDLLRPGGRFACAVDFYGENTISHSWPDDVGVAMTLLDASEWHAAFEGAGFANVQQERLRVPPEQASEPWKAEVGSLLTLGERR